VCAWLVVLAQSLTVMALLPSPGVRLQVRVPLPPVMAQEKVVVCPAVTGLGLARKVVMVESPRLSRRVVSLRGWLHGFSG